MPPVTLCNHCLPPPARRRATPVLQPGTVMQAMVAQLLDEIDPAAAASGRRDARREDRSALPAGTRVQIAVEGTVAQPKILLTPLPASPASASPQAASAPHRRNPASPASAIPLPAMSRPAPRSIAETGKPLPASVQLVLPEIAAAPKQALQAAVTAMVRDAVAKQNGLAPLMADVEAALTRPDVPQPVRAAAAQLLALARRNQCAGHRARYQGGGDALRHRRRSARRCSRRSRAASI